MSTAEVTYEQAIKELEQVVRSLEEGKLPLDEALKSFARGVELAACCQQQLASARGRVRELVATLEGYSLLDSELEA
ncbi:MAG: exodeoxyribonuclease VII small subunit [Methylocystaceae bacterium]